MEIKTFTNLIQNNEEINFKCKTKYQIIEKAADMRLQFPKENQANLLNFTTKFY